MRLTPTTLALRFGAWKRGKLQYSNQVLAVRDVADASAQWRKLRDEHGLASSTSPIVVVVDTATGEHIAKISYNGRAWAEDGSEICAS